MEGMADTDQRLCVNSFHANMYFTYTLQNMFVINQMCSFSLSNKFQTIIIFVSLSFCFTCTGTLYTNLFNSKRFLETEFLNLYTRYLTLLKTFINYVKALFF